jgi:Flp pilus assembly protein TadG
MTASDLLTRLRRAESGSVAVEFALLGPLMFGLLLGVLQIGVGMHGYNALRGISSDVARYVVVNYQTDNKLSNSQLTDYARSVATTTPYSLTNNDVQVSIVDASTQRVAGAKELTFSITYTVPSFLQVIDIPGFDISYSRPIFVLND